MAAAQNLSPIIVGFTPKGVTTGFSTLGLNASTTWLLLGFVLDSARTLTSVRVFLQTITGALGNNDLTCDIYSASGAGLGSSLASVALGASPATGWTNFTGFSLALSAQTQYWIVLKNVNGVPGTNFPTYQFGQTDTAPFLASNSNGSAGWIGLTDTNGSLGGFMKPTCGYRIGFLDGSYMGLPVQAIAASSDFAFGTQECGALLVTPAGATLNVASLGFMVRLNGSSFNLGPLRGRLYTGASSTPTRVGETSGLLAASVGSGVQWVTLYFASPIALPPSTTVRATISMNGGANGSSSNNFANPNEYTFDSDANSALLLPRAGTMKKTFSSDGVTFTDTANVVHPCVLELDSNSPFTAAGASGGVIRVGTQGGFSG